METRALYRNTGARIPREDGTWIERNQVFAPTDRELARLHYKLRLHKGDPPPAAKRHPPMEPVRDSHEPETSEWPLRMKTDMYLKLHPKGEHADLANRLIAEAKERAAQEQQEPDAAAEVTDASDV